MDNINELNVFKNKDKKITNDFIFNSVNLNVISVLKKWKKWAIYFLLFIIFGSYANTYGINILFTVFPAVFGTYVIYSIVLIGDLKNKFTIKDQFYKEIVCDLNNIELKLSAINMINDISFLEDMSVNHELVEIKEASLKRLDILNTFNVNNLNRLCTNINKKNIVEEKT